MTPLYVKDDFGHKPRSPGSKMCRESQQRVMPSSTTNFPPIAECNRLTSPGTHRRASHDGRTRWEPHRPTATTRAPSSRPRSYSDYSQGDVWSSGRPSNCSSNGRSSFSSFSSGDASTVASTEKLWRRRKLTPRRVVIRPVTPFPADEALHMHPAGENSNQILTPSPPQPKSTKTQPSVQARRRATCFSRAQQHQQIVEEQSAGKITPNRVRRETEDCSERKPHPPSQEHNDDEATNTSERRRRKSMPDMYTRPKGEVRKTDVEGKKTEARVLTEIMDRVTRERIMNWLTEVAHAKDEDHDALQEALSAIDEE